jgi:hypothetical protein
VTCFNPWTEPQWKPAKGSAILAREKEDAERVAHEREIAKLVKARDGRCRWPEAHKCRGGALEAAHIVDKSLVGATSMENEITLCPWLHRRGPESIHGKQLKVEKDTERGANGPLSFWRQTGEFDALDQPMYALVARELAPGGPYERD